ncbi:hypothetical protein QBC41DRAFT_385472 [Cercophora samala]|uniref:Uncharacterized protein n=1 Tax=Cercophora samala TaxID=330535 RepID=A0AA39ZIA1_9PEZI|nr:hypothetical protein QBC41DRAFT_385472 [Cercophora samala]
MKYTLAIIAAVGLTNAIALPNEPLSGRLVARAAPRAVRQPGFVTVRKRSEDPKPGPSRQPSSKGKEREVEVEDPVLDQLLEQQEEELREKEDIRAIEEAYETDSSSDRSRGKTDTPPTSEDGSRPASPGPVQPWQPDPDDDDPGSPTIPVFENSENREEEEDPYGWDAHAAQAESSRERGSP